MPIYLLNLSRKLLGSTRKTLLIMLQFLLLFTVFNVLAYDLWEERQQHRQVTDALGRDTFIIDTAIKDINALSGPDWPTSWLPRQIAYMRETFGERFSFYYSDYLLAAENDNTIDVIYLEEQFYQRVMQIYFEDRMLPHFHGGIVPVTTSRYTINGKIVELAPSHELQTVDVLEYLTRREGRPFLVLPAANDMTFVPGEVDVYPLYTGPLSNEERRRMIDELTRLNDGFDYSFRLLSELPEEQHKFKTGTAVLRLVFLAAASLMLFAGYIGSVLMLYAMNHRSLQTLRLFGAGRRHARMIVLAWNTYLLAPGCAAALPLSYIFIREHGGGAFFGSFLPFPLLLCGLLILLGALPLLRTDSQNHHASEIGGLQ